MQVRKTKQQIDAETAVEKLTEVAEMRVLSNLAAKMKEQPAVRLKLSKDARRPQLEVDHQDAVTGMGLLMSALGSCDPDFVNGMVRQLLSLNTYGEEVDLNRVNFMLSLIKGFAPTDQLEAMLAMQMAAVHVSTMKVAKRLDRSENVIEQDSTVRAFTKLARTFASQMEARTRYRAGAEQKVTLQQVSVGDGGQAIVGNVTQAPLGDGSEKDAAPPRSAFTASNVVPIPKREESRKRTPVRVRRTAPQ
jgi:hypothetical protein